jgi:hypothetical protein
MCVCTECVMYPYLHTCYIIPEPTENHVIRIRIKTMRIRNPGQSQIMIILGVVFFSDEKPSHGSLPSI